MNQRAVGWAEQAWGRSVVAVDRLSGGWTSDMLRLTADDGDRAVLRLMVREPWRKHAAGLLGRESDVQQQLAGGRVPTPRSLAVDAAGRAAGDPAHLMSHLPGQLDLTSQDEAFLGRLATLLHAIHSHDPGEHRPRPYQSWAHEAKRVIPSWTADPDLWKAAFQVLEQRPPAYDGVFLHRDFHLGNVLWEMGEPSGVVDWVETSWGPAALDIAHCATYLAMLHGLEAARTFRSIYGDLGNADDVVYWTVMDIVGYLPDPSKVVQPWRDVGRMVTDLAAQERLEGLLRQTLIAEPASGHR